MTKKIIYFGTLLLTALAFSSCASDDTATDKTAGKDTPKTGTVFSSEDEPSTRTSATYTGSGLDFYWTANDKIWVKDDNNTYHQSSEDDIASRIAAVPGSTTTAKAKFWVDGTYSNGTYKVRYTGKNGVQDKVTIKASQTQNTPNDAAHIADDGDFGVADTTGSGKYTFTLNHKAAYVTFMPYNANGVIPGAKIQKIRVYTSNTSDQLAGTFDLTDNGTLSNGTTTSNSVELNVNDFTLPSAYSYTTNGATMVLNPGTYNNVTIEYTLHDAGSNVTGTVKKTYPSVTFDAGKNTPVRADLQITVYPSDNYYMWDAQDQYWAGHSSSQPKLNNNDNSDFPQSGTSRYYNTTFLGSGISVPATNTSFNNIPNANEMSWYCMYGDPRWDGDKLWATMGHLYRGGMWFKKKSVLQAEGNYNTEKSADNITDLRITYKLYSNTSSSITSGGIPSAADAGNYFYLPVTGYYLTGKLINIGTFGYYWTSSTIPNVAHSYDAYALYFNNGAVYAGAGSRDSGSKAQKFSDFGDN